MLANELLYFVPAAIFAFLVTYVTIPVLRRVIKAINNRISYSVTELGIGNSTASVLGIFVSVLATFYIWGGADFVNSYSYLVAAILLFLLSGYKHGLFGMGRFNDLFFQVSAAAVLVMGAGMNINELGGLLGVGTVPYPIAVLISITFILAFSHSLKHLNRMSGLSGGVVVIASAFIGMWFWMAGAFGFAMLSLIISASVIGFLVYNLNSKSFNLGTTGSKTIGFILGYLSLNFLITNASVAGEAVHLENGIVFVVALMIVPLLLSILNMMNVFYQKIESDNHKLYDLNELVDLGLGEYHISFFLWIINIFVVGLAFSTMMLEINMQVALLFVTGFALLYIMRAVVIYSDKLFNIGGTRLLKQD